MTSLRSDHVIARLIARRASRPAVIWAVVYVLYTYASAVGYLSSYPTAASRAAFARVLAGNSGLTMLLGQARRIETVQGFTAWRCVGVLSIVGAVWGLLAGTRLVRGEEEAGRWELLLVGHTTPRRAAVQAAGGLFIAWVALCAATVLGCVVLGAHTGLSVSARAAAFYATVAAAPAALFLAVGLFCGQLAATRRRAAMIAGGVFGLSMLARMLADSDPALRWLDWVTPLGWIEHAHPLTGSQPLALLPVALLTAGLGAWACWLAGARDLGGGVLHHADAASARLALLTGPTGLAVRVVAPLAAAWVAGLAVLGLMFGLIARAAARAVADSDAFRRALAKLGDGAQGASAYLGLAFVVATTVICIAVAGRVVDARDEEADGRLDALLTRPVGRVSWLAGRLLVAVCLAVACAVAVGLATWAGTSVQHAGVSVSALAQATVNLLPAALAVIGIGTFVHGVAPRWTAVITYGLVAWSFLIEFIGTLLPGLSWLRDTSVLFHIVPAPAASPNWASAAGLVAVGVAGALAGTVAFLRRDVLGA